MWQKNVTGKKSGTCVDLWLSKRSLVDERLASILRTAFRERLRTRHTSLPFELTGRYNRPNRGVETFFPSSHPTPRRFTSRQPVIYTFSSPRLRVPTPGSPS